MIIGTNIKQKTKAILDLTDIKYGILKGKMKRVNIAKTNVKIDDFNNADIWCICENSMYSLYPL